MQSCYMGLSTRFFLGGKVLFHPLVHFIFPNRSYSNSHFETPIWWSIPSHSPNVSTCFNCFYCFFCFLFQRTTVVLGVLQPPASYILGLTSWQCHYYSGYMIVPLDSYGFFMMIIMNHQFSDVEIPLKKGVKMKRCNRKCLGFYGSYVLGEGIRMDNGLDLAEWPSEIWHFNQHLSHQDPLIEQCHVCLQLVFSPLSLSLSLSRLLSICIIMYHHNCWDRC